MRDQPFGRVRLIEMVVESVRVHMLSSQHVVILKESERDRYLPIWIGPAEANAIAMRLQGLSAERPLTHDLMVSVLSALNSSLSRVVVTHVTDEPEPTPAAPAKPRTPEPAAAPVDEMTFLKSVSDEEPSRMATRRPSNPGMPAVNTTTAPRESSAPSVAAAAGGGKTASGVAKTLKCGECGTLNRPTEWYCERCGAELASL